MSGNLTPDTSAALLQASQAQTNLSAGKLSNSKNLAAIERTAKEFEAVFISAMMKPMFDGAQLEGAFSGGKGEEIFQGMLVQEYGKMISQTGAIGLASDVKAKLIEMQGLKDPATTKQPAARLPIDTATDAHMDMIAEKLNNMTIGE